MKRSIKETLLKSLRKSASFHLPPDDDVEMPPPDEGPHSEPFCEPVHEEMILFNVAETCEGEGGPRASESEGSHQNMILE